MGLHPRPELPRLGDGIDVLVGTCSLYRARGRCVFERHHGSFRQGIQRVSLDGEDTLEQVLNYARRSESIDPENSRALYCLANYYFFCGDYYQSKDYGERIVKSNPSWRGDSIAKRCAFNDYVDGLNKDGLVTDYQAYNWSNPF